MSEVPPFVDARKPYKPDRSGWILGQYKELVAAIRFLSTLPLPGSVRLFRTDADDDRLFLGSAYFPLVGLLLAALLYLLVWIFGPLVSPLVLAALLVVALVLLTGGLHLDGLMDSCDGLFGGRSPEHKLEIMRDSRVGSFGVLGGICILLLKFSLLASLKPSLIVLALLTILPISRWTMVQSMFAFPSARATGLGAAFRQTVTRPRLICAALLSLIIALLASHIVGLILWFCATLIAWFIGRWITSKLGGLTGDSYGTLAELIEVILLLLFTLLCFWP
ncbi:adenosylcobinamide-GDP ribazoletransferase [Dictyobacter alpinus]|uniref:Adenosylcobinamide-GDP ribazoletransferase n=1 Tax=Dictyobacter alpinus TaxID=2014873 RepID=A0A402B112_9CHLR|nr:adenosylcobinamide-GDP ribazoletransferase [Dictyobacter alpinus]GCE25044.1 adenosylcobinamide-GDP ribazoletransferase [Dictyobacter alpinus]